MKKGLRLNLVSTFLKLGKQVRSKPRPDEEGIETLCACSDIPAFWSAPVPNLDLMKKGLRLRARDDGLTAPHQSMVFQT